MSRDQVMSRVDALVDALIDGVTARPAQVRGLTAEQVREVERSQPGPLGAGYRRFLERAGAGAGHFLQGSDVFYPRLLELGEGIRELLAENKLRFTLTDLDRVILMHQGYEFDLLRGDGPDPEVWSYTEGGPEPAPSYPSFTAWLEAQVAAETEAWARLVPWYEEERRKPEGERRVWFWRRQPDGTYRDEF
ncbi:MAG: SMI1/KNR4 family protein [Mycobacteriales bacterium]